MKSRKLIIKIVMFPLFGLLILSFAVWGIGDIFRTGGQTLSIAQVGDTAIDQRSFSRELSREISTMSRRFGTQISLDQARAFGIPQQVLSRMISRALLDETADRLGLLITEEQMRGLIFENPQFQDATGRFDRNRFDQALRFSNLNEAGFLQSLSQDTKRRQLSEAVTGGAAASKSLSEKLFSYREERRVADYVVIPNDSVGELGEPDETAVMEAYDSASSSFMTPTYKSITLVHLRVTDAAAEIAVADETLRSEFEARREELSEPERRAVTQTVLPDEAAAQALAQRLADGADFATAAKEATGRDPVDLGLVSSADLLPELSAAVFDLEAGEPSEPIQSPLGWHIVLVSEIQEGQEADFEALREQLSQEIAQAQAVDIVIEQANRYDQAIAGGLPIEEAAGNLGIPARTIAAIDPTAQDQAGTTVPDLPALNEFLEVLRDTAVGDTSLLTETLDGDYFIIRVDGETPATLKPLEEVREDVIRLWQVRERARLSEERAQALVERLEGGEDFTELADAEGLTLQKAGPLTRYEGNPEMTPSAAVSEQLFQIDVGEVTLVPTRSSQILAKLVEVLGAEQEGRQARLDSLSDQLSESISDDIFQQFLTAVQDDYELTINQRLIDETLSGTTY